VWVADITYIRIRTGFVYLAAILDACSRRVIGCAISTRIDTVLTLEALRMAIAELKHYGSEVSMARIGNPYENATMESFLKTLKYEEVYPCDCETMANVTERLPYFIEEVYNQKRVHFGIGSSPTQ